MMQILLYTNKSNAVQLAEVLESHFRKEGKIESANFYHSYLLSTLTQRENVYLRKASALSLSRLGYVDLAISHMKSIYDGKMIFKPNSWVLTECHYAVLSHNPKKFGPMLYLRAEGILALGDIAFDARPPHFTNEDVADIRERL